MSICLLNASFTILFSHVNHFSTVKRLKKRRLVGNSSIKWHSVKHSLVHLLLRQSTITTLWPLNRHFNNYHMRKKSCDWSIIRPKWIHQLFSRIWRDISSLSCSISQKMVKTRWRHSLLMNLVINGVFSWVISTICLMPFSRKTSIQSSCLILWKTCLDSSTEDRHQKAR